MKSSLMILFCLWLNYSASAQESKFKALFIYKFAEYIEWNSNPDKIVIGVVGKTDVLNQLSVFAASKENIEVLNIGNLSESNKCHIVFIPTNEKKQLPTYASSIGAKSILLVSEDGEKVSDGVDIGFFLESGKLRFFIDKQNIENKKMTPSSKLLSLGKNI